MSKGKSRIWTKDFIIIVIANFFIFTSFQMTLPTLPLYVQEIGSNETWVGIIVGIFTFSALLIRPFGGKMLDTTGRAPVFITGLAILVISLYSLAVSTTILILVAVRIVQGIGWGLSNTASGTIASDLVPKDRRGEGLGFFGLSGNLALAIGPALGLFLVNHIEFSTLFIICGSLTLIALLLALNVKYVKAEPLTQAEIEEDELNTSRFNFFEKRALPASALLFFITFTFGGIATFLPAYTFQQGFAPHYIQIYFVLYALALVTTRFFAGRIYDRRGLAIVFIPGSLLIIAGLTLLAILNSPVYLFVGAILYGLGFGTVQPALQASAINTTPPRKRGMANATFFSAFDLGVGLGAMTFGLVAQYDDYNMIYWVSAASGCLSLVLFFILRSARKIV
ncbi:Tetracycline resistance protein, class B [Jeotgalicoccus aerolatus]|uniref:MFS family permease n=1 Tax=Jeotgalicoccus aerolatus TaxID=709510 RepID=A0ABS4HL32_9STAP|nr:MFS transporter [Jeotgalicoccus aerolatus]MBP1951122.1 MFS family permease [Jeotgalicoccus aerolatus]GGE00071.1 MFS transporter [Jeotgalicoccus aerolatus]CAD2078010.1 Tetracycline resistance protein, class B [Jeotgalicoccus aerolatus]